MKNRVLTAAILASLCLPSLARADQAKYLKLPQQALAAFTSLANNAQRSIDITTFIFEPCHPSTQVIMQILERKARRGVRVRLLLDSIMQEKNEKRGLSAWAAGHGIELKWYHNALLPNPAQNHRSHAKLTVVDGESYISGGRNYADEYFGLYNGPNFVDRDLLVRGNSAREAQRSFEELWNASLSSKARAASSFSSWAKSCGKSESKRIHAIEKYLNGAQAILRAVPQRSCARVRFVSDAPDFLMGKYDERRDRGEARNYMSELRLRQKRVTKAVIAFLDGTRARLDAENWLYIPDGLINRSLQQLRKRRVPVTIITNEDMDGPAILKHAEEFMNTRAAQRDTKGSQAVIQVARLGSLTNNYELSPKGATYRLHGKVFVRDDSDVIVSSFNLDPRSYHTNLETAVIVDDCPALARDVKSGMRDLMEVYANDIKSGKLPAPEKKGLFGSLLGILGRPFL